MHRHRTSTSAPKAGTIPNGHTITTAGINFIRNEDIRIFPVPAGNELHLELKEMGSYIARIYDVTGRFVLGNPIHFNQSILLNTSWLETGTYLLQVQNLNGDPTYLRFIKQ